MVKNMMSIVEYYRDIEPDKIRFLKEILRQIGSEDYNDIFKNKLLVPGLDPYIIKDAVEFLRLSIINLLSYKHLIGGNYLAWSYVTSYYSLFYAINYFVRLKGFAVVNVKIFEGEKMNILTFKIERDWERKAYRFEKFGAKHALIWDRFSQLFPELASRNLGKAITSERAAWNYDLLYPSQTRDQHAIDEIRIKYENNFLDPNFGNYSSPEAAEYWHNILTQYGLEEVGPGDYIRIGLEYLVNIANGSLYKKWYESFLKDLLTDIDFFKAPEFTKEELRKLVQGAIDSIMQ